MPNKKWDQKGRDFSPSQDGLMIWELGLARERVDMPLTVSCRVSNDDVLHTGNV